LNLAKRKESQVIENTARRIALIDAAKRGLSTLELAERYCLIGSSYASSLFEEEMIQIIKEAAGFFEVSSRSIQLCGSAKFGFSLIKNTDFQPGRSDLDLAILDANCFGRYLEMVAVETKDLQERTLFADDAALKRYKSLLSRGIIRSDILPSIKARAEWDGFFNGLSLRNAKLFSKITAAVYLSDRSFIRKQATAFEPIHGEAQKA
jgi:hypothetical protein